MQEKLRIPKLLGDGCVLLRQAQTRVWGDAAPGTKVLVTLETEQEVPFDSLALTADEQGAFVGYFDNLKAGGPYLLRFKSETAECVSREVYVGDVFVCAGQSNMELPMNRVRVKYPEEFSEGAPGVHLYKVQEAYNFNREEKEHAQASWHACVPGNLGETSAFSYFLGKILSEREQVPVGILNLSLGGTPVQAWMSEEALQRHPAYLKERLPYQDAAYCRRREENAASAEAAWQRKLAEIEKRNGPSGWKKIRLPGLFSEEGLPDFCGRVELRKKVQLPGEAAGEPARLYLGTLTDADQTFVNGVFVGETTYCYPPRYYRIPAGVLREGENEITVRLVCRAGGGRMTKGKRPGIHLKTFSVSLAGEWEYRVLAEAERAPEQIFINRIATGLFQGMVAPCLPCSVRAVIWYQGESNDTSPGDYESLLRDMIEDWRARWMQDNLPFVIVQLPNCGVDIAGEDAWPQIRQAQDRAAQLPDTSLTVNLDIGENNDLHPLNKKDAAARAALALEKIVYKEEVCADGPRLLKALVPAGSSDAVLIFDRSVQLCTCGDGTEAGEHPLFELQDDSGCWHAAGAEQTKDGIRVTAADAAEKFRPCAVRYAWSSTPGVVLLAGPEGLLTSPFEVKTEEA